MYLCKICNEEVENIGAHIRHHHNMSAKDYYDKYLKTKLDGKCLYCGHETEFMTIKLGYRPYCSKECLYKDPKRLEKAKQTKLERYGDENYNNIDQAKQTCLEKYGVERAQSSSIVKDKCINTWRNKSEIELEQFRENHRNIWANKTLQQKQEIARKVKQTKLERYGDPNYNNIQTNKQTCQERYGTQNVYQSKDVKEKIKHILINKYGVEHPAQSPTILERMNNTCLNKYGVDFFPQSIKFKQDIREQTISRLLTNENIIDSIIQDDDVFYVFKCPHIECHKCSNESYISSIGHQRVRKYQGTELCTNLLPINYNLSKGTSIEIFVRNILDKYNILYKENDRKILKGKELDIYIPSKSLAIECNGIFWHSTMQERLNNNYHFNKWQQCKEEGIQLLTIWEDQIINKPQIIEGIIKSHLGIYEHKIGARQCIIREVSSQESNKFLEENHLQGKINGSIRLGLYYKNELVSLMMFGAKRRALGNKETSSDTYELYRYCNKLGWQIQGGASRLFTYFVDSHKNSIIESFSSNDISIGNLYKKLGFELVGEQKGSYWYIDKHMNRYHRFSFRKDKLVKEGYDPTKTEFEIANEIGLFRIYDSGQQKWIFHI